MHIKNKLNFFSKAAVIVFFAFCAITLVTQQFSFREIEEESVALQEQRNQLQDEIDMIRDQINRPFDEEYIKNVAREKLGYHMPQEIIFYNDLTKK